MDKQTWIEQIPFYLNGTLNDTDKRQFEQVLQQNPDWQPEIESWRILADAVFHEAYDRSKKLPPISARVREALYTDRAPSANGLPQLQVLDSPAEDAQPSQPLQNNRRTLTNAVGAFVTLAAAVAVLLTAGILFWAFDGSSEDDGTPAAIALAGTEQAATQTIQAGAPQAFTEEVDLLISPTAILPPTVTPLNAPPIPVSTATPFPLPNNSGGGGENPAAAAQLAPNEAGRGGGSFDSQALSTPNLDIAVRGNCYVERQPGTSPIPIYQFADKSSDVIGSMQPGQQLETWINTPKDGGDVFYQVFLPMSSIRLGWVDGTLVNLFGPDGGNCTNITNPTPTNPAMPGGLPTPFPDDNTCRVSSATGTTVRVHEIPNTSSRTIGLLNFGDLLTAREFYTGEPGWYWVIVPGIGFGYLLADSVNTNGNCAALPQTNQYTQPTPAGASPVPQRPTLSASACRVTAVNGSGATMYISPSESTGIIGTATSAAVEPGTWFVTRRTPNNGWYFLSELADGRYQNRGWVLVSSVQVEGACNTQPAISATDWAATQQPQVLPDVTEEVIVESE